MAGNLTFDWDKAAAAEIDAALRQLKDGTQRVAAQAALAQAQAELEAAKAAAPAKTGTLRDSLVLHMERNRPNGKQVYDVLPTAKANGLLQKQVKQPGRTANGKRRRKTASYSATVNGGRVAGKHYLGGSMAAGSEGYREAILEEIEKNVDEAWGQ